jgi:hypothetical protein
MRSPGDALSRAALAFDRTAVQPRKRLGALNGALAAWRSPRAATLSYQRLLQDRVGERRTKH